MTRVISRPDPEAEVNGLVQSNITYNVNTQKKVTNYANYKAPVEELKQEAVCVKYADLGQEESKSDFKEELAVNAPKELLNEVAKLKKFNKKLSSAFKLAKPVRELWHHLVEFLPVELRDINILECLKKILKFHLKWQVGCKVKCRI